MKMETRIDRSERDLLERLSHAYRCLQDRSCPNQSHVALASDLFSGVSGGMSAEDTVYAPAVYVELTCLTVTLLRKIISTLMTRSLPTDVASYFSETLWFLFQDMDIMPHLVHHFQSANQIISHLAAKSVSAYIVCHLHQCDIVNPIWEKKCLQTFHISAPSNELDSCLWSLTDALKRLLKEGFHEVFGKLLATFDSSLIDLCLNLLHGERNKANTTRFGTTFCLLMDLLEVLTASSLRCGIGICLQSQRLTHIHSSVLMRMISCSSDYFVKKRTLLLLKRTVLGKTGEEWALGDVPYTGLKHKDFNADMNVLTQSVLIAGAANWLESVQVDSAALFGSTRSMQGNHALNPDCVMLRAVSLLFLKSVELHIHTASGTGMNCATELPDYLKSLWGFLKRHSMQLMETKHVCCWVNLLFGEQDDDMMEAAKALLSIFLHYRHWSALDDSAVLEAACDSGSNPHCHFLLLLQSISFDHSVLLDFLISTETCFLEYFVCYLKYLRADWQGFSAACGQISTSVCHLQKVLATSCDANISLVTCKGQLQEVELSPSALPTRFVSPVEVNSLVLGPCLVDYSSSDESGPENMDYQADKMTSGFSDLDMKEENSGFRLQKQTHFESSCSRQPTYAQETRAEGSLPISGYVTCEASTRAVGCLSELREVLKRLQEKDLFPYNASSLLKLLAQVCHCSQKSHFNKCVTK